MGMLFWVSQLVAHYILVSSNGISNVLIQRS